MLCKSANSISPPPPPYFFNLSILKIPNYQNTGIPHQPIKIRGQKTIVLFTKVTIKIFDEHIKSSQKDIIYAWCFVNSSHP